MGAYVIVNYHSAEDKAEGVVQEIIANGGHAESYGCDVADFTAVGSMIQDLLEKHGHIDIPVNNAGITRDQFIGKDQ